MCKNVEVTWSWRLSIFIRLPWIHFQEKQCRIFGEVPFLHETFSQLWTQLTLNCWIFANLFLKKTAHSSSKSHLPGVPGKIVLFFPSLLCVWLLLQLTGNCLTSTTRRKPWQKPARRSRMWDGSLCPSQAAMGTQCCSCTRLPRPAGAGGAHSFLSFLQRELLLSSLNIYCRFWTHTHTKINKTIRGARFWFPIILPLRS